MIWQFQDIKSATILNFLRVYKYRLVGCLLILLLGSVLITNLFSAKTERVWSAQEVPVAFWAWQTDLPGNSDIEKAKTQIGIQRLFIRAGQIDFANSGLRRIRPAKGKIPSGIEIQFVYN